jgi:hypothetical protein
MIYENLIRQGNMTSDLGEGKQLGEVGAKLEGGFSGGPVLSGGKVVGLVESSSTVGQRDTFRFVPIRSIIGWLSENIIPPKAVVDRRGDAVKPPLEIEGPKHKAWVIRTQFMNRTVIGGTAIGHGPSEHVNQMRNLDLGERIVAVEAWPGEGCDTFSFLVRTVDGRLENRPSDLGFGGHKGRSPKQHVEVPPGDFIVQYSCEHGEMTDAWTFWTNGGKQLRVGGRGHPRSTLPIGVDPYEASTTIDSQPLKYELIGGKVTFGKTIDTFQGVFRPYFTAEQLREPDKSE